MHACCIMTYIKYSIIICLLVQHLSKILTVGSVDYGRHLPYWNFMAGTCRTGILWQALAVLVFCGRHLPYWYFAAGTCHIGIL